MAGKREGARALPHINSLRASRIAINISDDYRIHYWSTFMTLTLPALPVKSALHSWVIITVAKQTAALEGNAAKPTLLSTAVSSEKDRWKGVSIAESIASATS
jgi:hypothetical protein